MRQWRLIYDQPMNGAANMAADEAIMRSVAAGEQPPTIRLYAWEPFCISLGFGQRARDVDIERLEAHEWEVVRRPTGGRAILHGDELTYSVSLAEDHPIAAGGIVETYLRLSKGLLRAMEQLGLNVLADAEGDTESEKGPVCFEVPSKYEITVGGKKLIGSAQLRRRSGVLQHGTIPLYGDIARICDALVYENEDEREKARIQVRERAATLESAGLVGISWDMAAKALAKSFSETLDIELVEGELSEREIAAADKLYKEVYASAEWTFKR
jgi:lipoate-protein ligase A